ncbi:NAD(P)(+) transhydrogenase (Re/Si-specific) subunit beta [Microvirga sp. TS319]
MPTSVTWYGSDLASLRDSEAEQPDRRDAGSRGPEGQQVLVSKRGQGTGYSGIENPLFYKDNTRMFSGDARRSIGRLLASLV